MLTMLKMMLSMLTLAEKLIPTRKNVKQWKQAIEIVSQIKKVCENKHLQAQKIIDNEQAQCDLIESENL